MKTTRIIIATMCLLAAITAWAGPISETQARSIAANFMASHAMSSTSLRIVQKAPRLGAPGASVQAAYYVFNADREGYVIVAGDDRAPAVLGYSDKGHFDMQNIPEAMQELLESYSVQMEALDQGARVSAHLSGRNAITPLVKAQWSQNAPYNILLPIIKGKHAYVGCVATAIAQVMYYWKWPARPTKALPSYTTEDLSIYMPSLPVVDFDWNNMRDTYLTSDTLSVQAFAAAQLSKYCAQSVNMDFKETSSSASTSSMSIALTTYFGYNPAARCTYRERYTTEDWEQMLYNELAANRPVIYRGAKATSGHAFVCDGYDGNGLFHINWGWNGASNGYFLLNILNPDAQGTGSASGSYGYIYGQAMIIDLEPGNVSNAQLEVVDRLIEIGSYSSTRSGSGADFSVTQTTQFLNESNDAISFDYAWGLFNQNNELISIMNKGQKSDLPSWYYTYPTRTLYFGRGLTSGTYRIIPIYSVPNAENWKQCIGGNINYIEVAIHGNSCTVTCHGDSQRPSYGVNNVNITGHYHPGRPLNISMNVTNLGNTRNDLVYMFANGKFFATGFVDLAKGESGDVNFMYSSETTGSVTLKFCYDEEGNNPFYTKTISIASMPAATLSGKITAFNVSATDNSVILSDKFSIELEVTNNNTTTYDEDITFKLYKQVYGNYGSLVQTITKPLYLARRQNGTLLVDFDNVMDGWKYFIKAYYYSSGEEKSLAGSYTYTIEYPKGIRGDVNNDGEVNIADVNTIIAIILGRSVSDDVKRRADVTGDGEVNIADANATIAIILNK